MRSSVSSCMFCCFFVLSAGTLLFPDEFKRRLLWLSMMCFVLFMQL